MIRADNAVSAGAYTHADAQKKQKILTAFHGLPSKQWKLLSDSNQASIATRLFFFSLFFDKWMKCRLSDPRMSIVLCHCQLNRLISIFCFFSLFSLHTHNERYHWFQSLSRNALSSFVISARARSISQCEWIPSMFSFNIHTHWFDDDNCAEIN